MTENWSKDTQSVNGKSRIQNLAAKITPSFLKLKKEREQKEKEAGKTKCTAMILVPRQNLLLNASVKPPVLKLCNITNSDSVEINFGSDEQSQVHTAFLMFLMFQNYTDFTKIIHTNIYITDPKQQPRGN